MEIHEAALIIPAMTEEEFQNLKQDIKEQGQLEPIALYNGEILDGIHRNKACEELGIKPKTVAVKPESPTLYVLSKNVHRRHLEKGQLAFIAKDAEELLAMEAKERKSEAAKQRQDPVTGKLQPMASNSTPTVRDRDRDSAVRAAKAVGVGATSVKAAKRIEQVAPEIAEEVRSGKISLNAGKAKASKEIQSKMTHVDSRPDVTRYTLKAAEGFRSIDSGQQQIKSAIKQISTFIAELNGDEINQLQNLQQKWQEQLAKIETATGNLFEQVEIFGKDLAK